METKNKITDDVVIAKNPKPLGIVNGEIIFNEWLIPKDIWNKNYGFKVDNVQKEYKKIKTINAIKITDDVLLKLGSKNGLTARIKVNFSENGMVVYKGGLLTDQGYGIAPQELKDTYNLI